MTGIKVANTITVHTNHTEAVAKSIRIRLYSIKYFGATLFSKFISLNSKQTNEVNFGPF